MSAMTADVRPIRGPRTRTPAEAYTSYAEWLVLLAPLSANTKRTYKTQARLYAEWLAGRDGKHGDPLADAHARDYAVRDYKSFLLRERKRKPHSVNTALAAVQSFYLWLGLGAPVVDNVPLQENAPRSLDEEPQRDLKRAAERRGPRDLAIVGLFLDTGARISELAALDLDDLRISERKGILVIRGKGVKYREVPLSMSARRVARPWLDARPGYPGAEEQTALFLSRSGSRLSKEGIDGVVRACAKAAGVKVSAHMLRHSFGTNLRRAGVDMPTIQRLMGHSRMDTTSRYAMATDEDMQAAVDVVDIDF